MQQEHRAVMGLNRLGGGSSCGACMQPAVYGTGRGPRPRRVGALTFPDRLNSFSISVNSNKNALQHHTATMRALLLLSLVALVAARCPEGMKPVSEDEIEAAAEIGLNRRAPRFGEGHPARLQPCTRAVRHGRRTESADRWCSGRGASPADWSSPPAAALTVPPPLHVCAAGPSMPSSSGATTSPKPSTPTASSTTTPQ